MSLMSAIGPKRTSLVAPHMSALRVKRTQLRPAVDQPYLRTFLPNLLGRFLKAPIMTILGASSVGSKPPPCKLGQFENREPRARLVSSRVISLDAVSAILEFGQAFCRAHCNRGVQAPLTLHALVSPTLRVCFCVPQSGQYSTPIPLKPLSSR
jgi:hypothetical protein